MLSTYRCWSEGERELDLSAVLLLLDDRVNRRGKAAFLKHGLQGDAEIKEQTYACMHSSEEDGSFHFSQLN